MTSFSSGYISVRRNVSDSDPSYLWRNISVPAKNTIVISFKEKVQDQTDVTLFCHLTYYDNYNNRSANKKSEVWSRKSVSSDFAHLHNTTLISVRVLRDSCINTTCFRLFFSFFPVDKTPLKSSNGVWNCSVNHYASFHHHLACNLKTECEDGRDETGDCPFSSPQCQGLIAFCNRCYKIVDSLRGFVSDETDFNKRANDYCNSEGSQLSLPKCLFDWYWAIRNKTKVHPKRLEYLWTGLYTDDNSLPNMYVHSIVHADRTALHHSVGCILDKKIMARICFRSVLSSSKLSGAPCEYQDFYSWYLQYGALCEFTEKTEKHNNRSETISLNRTEVWFPIEQQSPTNCTDGHIMHTFLMCAFHHRKMCSEQHTSLCNFPDLGYFDRFDSSVPQISAIHTFICNDNLTVVSYTLVCDFISDCPDESDESFCEHPPCINKFRCTSGQCLSFAKLCDNVFHCQDKSDETKCEILRIRLKDIHYSVQSPVTINFDGIKYFISTPLNSNESCPDSHYRCPGEFNDCLPVYTRCNGMYDCIDHEDEDGCEKAKCPGLFRCRFSKQCLHSDNMCDGWPHCPMNDDEISCNIICPEPCVCEGYTFLCSQPFSAARFPQLRYLDATGSGMTLLDLSNNTLLVTVIFAHCSMTVLPKAHLLNLRFLDLSDNKLRHINLTSLHGLKRLQALSLSNNPLTSLQTDRQSLNQRSSLTELDVSHTPLTVLDTELLSLFPGLQKLNLSFTFIHTVSSAGFHFTPQLSELHMDHSPIKTFPPDIFQDLSNLRFLSTDNYKFCCSEILPYNFNKSACLGPKDEISSCEDLLQSWTYRGFLWLVTFLSLTGNVFSYGARLLLKNMASSASFNVFVTNLIMGDFLMGVYVAIVGVADEWFRGRYLHNDDDWKSSLTCKTAGFLSLLSSEVSAFIIWFITLDRFIVLRFPFSSLRFDVSSAAGACVLTWFVACFLALLPLLPVTSHWEFYSQTGICIPLPVTLRDFEGKMYSFSVLIVLNFVLFLLVSAGQAFIYWSIQSNAMKINSTKVSRDITIARRLITVAVTDFMCWFPIGLCGMLALAGVPISGEVNVALAIFVLPLNAAINPFVYTFNRVAENRRKSKEAELLKWMRSQTDMAAHHNIT